MDRIRTKKKIVFVAVLLATLLVTLSAPASAARSTAADVNLSYHAAFPEVTPEAAAAYAAGDWVYGSSMYSKWCGLPNMVMTYDGKDYSQVLSDFTDGNRVLDVANISNLEWGTNEGKENDILTADPAEWERYCASCHVGGGGFNGSIATDIECGACHTVSPASAVLNDQGYTGTTSCFIKCHQNSDTGSMDGYLTTSSKDIAKRDMKFQPSHDVHADNEAFDLLATNAGYGDNTCLVCHMPGSAPDAPAALDGNTHNFGRGWTTDTAMQLSTMGTVKACDDADCHATPHENAILNEHTDTITCFVCHTDKTLPGATATDKAFSLSAADWTILTEAGSTALAPNAALAKIKFKASKAEHSFSYFWLGETGGDNALRGWDPSNLFNVYPFIDDASSNKGATNAKIAMANSINLKMFVYGNHVDMLGIDRDVLWAADQLGNKDNEVTANELANIGYVDYGDKKLELVQEGAKFSAHNINLGGELGNPYTCDDCHVESGGILDFADLGYSGNQLGLLNGTIDNTDATAIHEFVVADVGNVSFTLNDCAKCHGNHVPSAPVSKDMINTTIIPAPSDAGNFDVNGVKLTDINGDVFDLTDGFVPTRYDIDFGEDTASNVSLKIRDVYLDDSSIIAATVASTSKPKDLSPDMIQMSGTLFDVSVDPSLDGVRYTVTIGYNPDDLDEYGAQHLRMFHYNSVSDEWEDCTTSINTQDETVTGTTTSLSPFVVAVWPDATTATSFSTVGMMSLMGLFAVFVMYISKRRDE